MSITAANEPRVYRLSVSDFHRMGEVGIFTEDDRVELIEGEIIQMAPIGSSHAGRVARLTQAYRKSGWSTWTALA